MLGAYCWPQSARPRETVALFCEADSFDLTIIRDGGREEVVRQAAGGAGCEIEIDPAWTSGFYRVEVSSGDERGNAFFIVRPALDDVGKADAVMVVATSTYAAYNDYGAPSFYTGAHESSLLRPLPRGFITEPEQETYLEARLARDQRAIMAFFRSGPSMWSQASGWSNWERRFVQWAERLGLVIHFAASQDLDSDPNLLDGYSTYLSIGHDEYWSRGMRDAVEGYVDAGGHAAFFSGNTSFWQIRYADDYTSITAYKNDIDDDPVRGTDQEYLLSTMWSDPLVGRPENEMTGVSFTHGGYARISGAPTGSGGYTVWRPSHWALDGLDLMTGDLLGTAKAVIGYECDGCEMALVDGRPVPTGRDGTPIDFEIVATAPAHLWATDEAPAALPDHYIGELNWVAARLGGADTPEVRERFAYGQAVMGSYRRGAGEVFTTGCTDWAYGLGDPEVDRLTVNVLRHFGWQG